MATAQWLATMRSLNHDGPSATANVSPACWPEIWTVAGRFGPPVLVRAYVCHRPPPGWVAASGVEIVDGRPADGPNAADFLMAMDAAALAVEARVGALRW